MAMATHVIAQAVSAATPMAPSHCSASACGRKPMATATPSSTPLLSRVWITLPARARRALPTGRDA